VEDSIQFKGKTKRGYEDVKFGIDGISSIEVKLDGGVEKG